MNDVHFQNFDSHHTVSITDAWTSGAAVTQQFGGNSFRGDGLMRQVFMKFHHLQDIFGKGYSNRNAVIDVLLLLQLLLFLLLTTLLLCRSFISITIQYIF